MKLVVFILVSLFSGNKMDGDFFATMSHEQQKAIATLLFDDCPMLKIVLEKIRSFPTDTSKVTLNLYTGTQRISFPLATAGKQLLASKYFNKNLPTVIYCHGYFEDLGFEGTTINTDALLKKEGLNVLALDASPMIRLLYLYAAESVKFIGKGLGKVFYDLVVDGNISPQSIHIIGFSLGAHIAGFAGKQLQNLKNVKIGRITGLDPAGPCFFKQVKDLRLNNTDADFVDVIHTDAGALGITDPIGHVDFYPNGGYGQPGATIITLNHLRAYAYYAETIGNEKTFPAVKCSNWGTFKSGSCANGEQAYMGYGVSKTTRGTYYLWTKAFSPYSLNEKGTHPSVSFSDTWLG